MRGRGREDGGCEFMLTDDDVEKVVARIQAAMPQGAKSASETGPEAPGAAPSKPRVRLPGEGRMIDEFAAEVGAILAKDGVYMRDTTAVVLDPVTRRMVELDADCMRSYASKSLITVKMKKVNDEVVPVPVPMARETAVALLAAHDFKVRQRSLRAVSEVPLPVLRGSGELALLAAGYDAESQVLVLGEKNL